MRTIHRLLDLGTEATGDPVEARHVRLTNAIALIASGWLVATHLLSLAFVPFFPEVFATAGAVAVAAVLTLMLNARHQPHAARIWLIASFMLYTVINSLLMGPALDNHFFLLPNMVAAFAVFPPRQRHWALGFAAAGVATFLALDHWFRDHGALVELPFPAKDARPVLFLALFVAVVLIEDYVSRVLRQAEVEVRRARQQADDLLRNILPGPIVERLKLGETPIADRCEAVTILFADLVGFTTLSQTMSADRLVTLLDDVFSTFDAVAQRHGIEKIKTIGDAYMAVAGVPVPREDHPDAVASAALELRDALAAVNATHRVELAVRIGIHTGPVVAGVIGQSKFAYDLWGDAVNIASRMESHGVPGRIQVSRAAQERLQERFVLTPRGTVDIKGKGPMETWFLDAKA